MGKMALYTVVFCFLAGHAQADVTVVRSLTLTPENGDGAIEARALLEFKGKESRRETFVRTRGSLSKVLPPTARAVNLISLDIELVQRMDSRIRQVQRIPLSQWVNYLQKDTTVDLQPLRVEQSWSRVLPEEFEIMNEHRCRKITYEWHFQVFNPETLNHREYDSSTTLWVADSTPLLERTLDEETAFRQLYFEKVGGMPLEDLNRLTLKFARQWTGLSEDILFLALAKGTAPMPRLSGYVVASETTWYLSGSHYRKPLFRIRSAVESLSLNAIPDAEFNDLHFSSAFLDKKSALPLN